MAGNAMEDLLGPPSTGQQYSHQQYIPGTEYYTPPSAPDPGKTVDLSGHSAASYSTPPPGPSFRPPSGPSSSSSTGFGSRDRGPSSLEGGSGPTLSLSSLNPQAIMQQLTSRPLTEVVTEQGRNLMQIPRYMARAYTAAARRYLRPWNEFARLNPSRILEGVRQASRRGEIQIYFQRNVIANARHFCPNYAFIFLAMLFMFVCTSPMLLMMLAGVGGGWSHAMRSEQFRNRPWTLAIGGVQVPLGSNMKMLIMALPTLLFLHLFMGPVLWSAALCSGGVSLAHAALRDRDDVDKLDDADDRDGLTNRIVSTSVHEDGERIRDFPLQCLQLSMTYAASLLAGAFVERLLFNADLHFLRAVEDYARGGCCVENSNGRIGGSWFLQQVALSSLPEVCAALAAVALKILGQGAPPGFCAPVHRTRGRTLAQSALASREVFAEERSDYEEDSEPEDDLGVPKLTRSAFKLETSRQDADKLDIDAVSAMVQGELTNAGFKVQMHDGQPSMDLIGAGDAEVLRAAAAALQQHALRREPPTEDLMESLQDLLAEQQVDPLVVSSLMWSCGRLVADTRPLLPTLRDVVVEAARDMNAQNLTSCWCSAANLQPYAEEVDEMIPALLSFVLPKAADLQPSQLVAFIWASGKLDLRQDEVAQISALPKRLRRFELEILPLKDIANFVFGLSQLDFRDMDVLGMIAKTATGRVAKSKRKEAHQDLPMIVMSLTRLGYKDMQMNLLLDAVADRLQKTRMLKKMPDWSLAALFWAWPQDGSLDGVRNMQELLAPEVQQRMRKNKFTSRMLERSWMGPAEWRRKPAKA
ncbi:UVR8 [Symbiodinium necroappetens]|uniref:UVR8 protein n=1 Tax=Symbiodinium necroappetens TaxID=1628268 RepID=A0A813BTH9_9DINO|nr:UVR8 [Symbiodinium necroappetens]